MTGTRLVAWGCARCSSAAASRPTWSARCGCISISRMRARAATLTKLARQVDGDVATATDKARTRALAAETRRLAAASK